MGNPLSPILAEILMDNLEKTIHKHHLSKNCIYWYRYVDDILACFIGTDRQLHTFEKYINSIHPNIEFSIEIEQDKSINFLDITITRLQNKHEFSIFRKPSHTDTTIHSSSIHPYQQKVAAYNSMIHRLLHIPLSETNFARELNIIKQVAYNNGYNPDLIDSILQKKKYKIAIQQAYPHYKEIDRKFTNLTYIGKTSDKLGSFLSDLKVNISFKTDNNLGKYIKNYKSKTSNLNKSGVYKLNCADCDKMYIGRTYRKFQTRINEHRKCYENKKRESNYSNHCLEENHAFNSHFEILHTCERGLRLNFLETMEINKQRYTGRLLNSQLDINSSPLLNLFPVRGPYQQA